MIDVTKIKNKEFSHVSLFSGAGGLDIGFCNKGFKTIWANDIDKDACETHKLWSNAIVTSKDISEINLEEIPDSDIITGGFPCQGFSLAGPRKINDNRNILYKHFVKIVEVKKPKVFVAENVKGILTLDNGKIIEAIIENFAERGYHVFVHLLNAADYGVPQDRWRVIMIGFRKDLNVTNYEFPKPFNIRVTLKEALKNIPEPLPEDICDAPFSSRYMSRNRKRSWDSLSYTIPAMSKQVTLHPLSPNMEKVNKDLWKFGDAKTTRRFSWQEAAAIQTFPKDMIFHGNLTSKYKQIGNAVPVKLAEVIASEIRKVLETYVRG